MATAYSPLALEIAGKAIGEFAEKANGLERSMNALWSSRENKAQLRRDMLSKGRKFIIPAQVWNR